MLKRGVARAKEGFRAHKKVCLRKKKIRTQKKVRAKEGSCAQKSLCTIEGLRVKEALRAQKKVRIGRRMLARAKEGLFAHKKMCLRPKKVRVRKGRLECAKEVASVLGWLGVTRVFAISKISREHRSA